MLDQARRTGDDLSSRIGATEARYRDRTVDRERTKRIVRERGILHADTPERVASRLRELNVDLTLATAIEQTPAEPSTGRSVPPIDPELFGADVLGLERLMGRNDLVDVGFLQAGADAARSVGRITVRDPGKLATGFLVAPRVLLTNNHVLADADEAGRAYVEFNYQSGPNGIPLTPVAFQLDPDSLFLTDHDLDFTMVAVQEHNGGGVELAQFGWLPLIARQGKIVLGELVNIVQHPNGEPKQLALRENQIVDLLDDFIHYETDTAPGSSGSPVFSDQWNVVALHHSGVPKRDDEGHYLAVDGSRWVPAMGEDRLAWEANEGVRVSRLLAAVRTHDLPASAAALIVGLESATPVVDTAPATTPAAAAPAAFADGTLRFTVPLEITVGLAGATPSVAPAASADGAGAAVALRPTIETPRLRAALVDLEAGRARPYYDATADEAARTAYYAQIDEHLAPSELYAALSTYLESTHRQRPRYDPMHMVYPWVDLQPEGNIKSIYSGKEVDPETFIREDAEVEAAHAVQLRELTETAAPGALEAALDLLEAALPYNCEHVVPQSWFGKQEPMRGDLHHLFACASRCNSFRGNYPYFEFAVANEAVQSDCGRREDEGFEPVAGRGSVARATLYFLMRYPGFVGDEERELHVERVAMLRAWHAAHPVEDYERHRNMAIAEIQGNRNPLIDHPEWANAIAFEDAFGQR